MALWICICLHPLLYDSFIQYLYRLLFPLSILEPCCLSDSLVFWHDSWSCTIYSSVHPPVERPCSSNCAWNCVAYQLSDTKIVWLLLNPEFLHLGSSCHFFVQQGHWHEWLLWCKSHQCFMAPDGAILGRDARSDLLQSETAVRLS